MGESNVALNEFVGFLSSPDMYGSISTASMLTKWLVHAVVTLLMIAAVIGILFVMIKFAVDILYLSGLGHMYVPTSDKGKAFKAKLDNFSTKDAHGGDIMAYLKGDFWKPIVTLAFIGLLASGTALPLAGVLAGTTSAFINKLIDLDIEGSARGMDFSKFKVSLKYKRADDLKARYDKEVARARTYRDQIYDLGSKDPGSDNAQLMRIKQNYTQAMIRANLIGKSMGNKAKELKLPSSYFKQHNEDGLCESAFLDKTVINASGGGTPCK